jgi:hypothetical protein
VTTIESETGLGQEERALCGDRRYTEWPELARLARLGDHPLPHRQRSEPAGFEIISQRPQERFRPEDNGAWLHPIDPGRACPPVAANPVPRNHEEGGIADEVEQVIEPTIRAVGRPLVQLGLDPQHPGRGGGEPGAGGDPCRDRNWATVVSA